MALIGECMEEAATTVEWSPVECGPEPGGRVAEGDPGRPPLRLLEVVRRTARAHHLSRRTENAYVGWIRRYVVFHRKRHPREVGASGVNEFLTWLATERRVSASTQNQASGALLFLYRQVLQLPVAGLDDVVRARRPDRLPVVLTRPEVQRPYSTDSTACSG